KILSIMSDNMSNNDTMISELVNNVAHFKGKNSQTHCFLHVVNLIVKSLIRQFDPPK
ncbi:uncharacterized protein EDB91DRAFT_1066154, partial [Suillus paluster]|uniref:uncharacterized protein n=1 Tax=Suillus paluster TaxID=48578 RepID=UPI001B871411